MNIATISVGLRNLAIYRLQPKMAKAVHTATLIKESQIPLVAKLQILSDPRTTKYWDVLLKPTGTQKENRAFFNINPERHIKEFDPTGQTLGCGCSLCTLNHKVYLLETEYKKFRLQRAILSRIQELKTKDIRPEVFYTSLKEYGFILAGFDKPDDTLEKLQIILAEKEILASRELSAYYDGIKNLTKMCGLPIKNKNRRTVAEQDTYQKIKSRLLRTNNLESLDLLTEIVPMVKTLNLCKVNDVNIKNIVFALQKWEKIHKYSDFRNYTEIELAIYAEKTKRLRDMVTGIKQELINYLEVYRDKLGYLA